MKKYFRLILAAIMILVLSNDLFAQLDLPRLSPNASIMQNIGITKVEIKYNRPAVRDRKIWGELVPYNEVWRTGANEATTIEFSSDVKVNGIQIPAGKYSLFTIPTEQEWTVIFNKQADQWGAFNYKEANDFVRFKVKPQKNDFFERLLYYFSETSTKEAVLNIAWENLKISFNIESYLTKDNDKNVRVSPAAAINQRVGLTDIKLTFGSPEVKGRAIWGKLVPYNEVWRAGANEATTIEFSSDIYVEGTKVPKGKYSFFTIPGEKEWTIIFNKVASQWGAFKYDSKQDFIRFKAVPKSNPFNERLFFNFSDVTDNSATISLLWENLSVSFKVNIELEKIAYESITKSIEKAKADDWKIYLSAANYGIENNFFNDEPLKWIDKSLSIQETYQGYFTKAKFLYNNKKYDEALKQLELCRDKGQSSKDYQNFISQVDNLARKIKDNIK